MSFFHIQDILLNENPYLPAYQLSVVQISDSWVKEEQYQGTLICDS